MADLRLSSSAGKSSGEGGERRARPADGGVEKLFFRDLLGLIDRGMDDKVMLSVERMLAERACERIIVDFIHRLDLGDPSSGLAVHARRCLALAFREPAH